MNDNNKRGHEGRRCAQERPGSGLTYCPGLPQACSSTVSESVLSAPSAVCFFLTAALVIEGSTEKKPDMEERRS